MAYRGRKTYTEDELEEIKKLVQPELDAYSNVYRQLSGLRDKGHDLSGDDLLQVCDEHYEELQFAVRDALVERDGLTKRAAYGEAVGIVKELVPSPSSVWDDVGQKHPQKRSEEEVKAIVSEVTDRLRDPIEKYWKSVEALAVSARKGESFNDPLSDGRTVAGSVSAVSYHEGCYRMLKGKMVDALMERGLNSKTAQRETNGLMEAITGKNETWLSSVCKEALKGQSRTR